MVVSIHFPKAAGNSLLEAYRGAYGSAVVHADYSDDPADMRSAMHLDPDYIRRAPPPVPDAIELIHGHFHPRRYEHLRDALFITFLRHPVPNLISIYSFWKTLPRTGNPLHEYFLDHELSVVETARLPALRYLLSKTYFGGFDLRRLGFIGNSETFADDLARLSRLLGKPLAVRRDNVTAPDDGDARERYENLQRDSKLIAALSDILADDVRLFEEAQSLRKAARALA